MFNQEERPHRAHVPQSSSWGLEFGLGSTKQELTLLIFPSYLMEVAWEFDHEIVKKDRELS